MSVFFLACKVCMCVSLQVYPIFHSVCILLFTPCVSFFIPCVYPTLCVFHSIGTPLSIASLKVYLAPSLTLKPWSQLCSERYHLRTRLIGQNIRSFSIRRRTRQCQASSNYFQFWLSPCDDSTLVVSQYWVKWLPFLKIFSRRLSFWRLTNDYGEGFKAPGNFPDYWMSFPLSYNQAIKLAGMIRKLGFPRGCNNSWRLSCGLWRRTLQCARQYFRLLSWETPSDALSSFFFWVSARRCFVFFLGVKGQHPSRRGRIWWSEKCMPKNRPAW